MYFEEYRGHSFHNNMGWTSWSASSQLITSISTKKREYSINNDIPSVSFVAEYPGPCYRRGLSLKNLPEKKREDWQNIFWPTYEQSIEIEKEMVRRLKILIDEYEDGMK